MSNRNILAGTNVSISGTETITINSSDSIRLNNGSSSVTEFRQNGTAIGTIGGQGGTDFLIQSSVSDKDELKELTSYLDYLAKINPKPSNLCPIT